MNTKYQAAKARCAVCNGVVYGTGWFCSAECDSAERIARTFVPPLVAGLRAAAVPR